MNDGSDRNQASPGEVASSSSLIQTIFFSESNNLNRTSTEPGIFLSNTSLLVTINELEGVVCLLL